MKRRNKCVSCDGYGYNYTPHAPDTEKEQAVKHVHKGEKTWWAEVCEKCGGYGYIEEEVIE